MLLYVVLYATSWARGVRRGWWRLREAQAAAVSAEAQKKAFPGPQSPPLNGSSTLNGGGNGGGKGPGRQPTEDEESAALLTLSPNLTQR